MYAILGMLIFVLVTALIFFSVVITLWWFWRRATTPEGEAPPRWGDPRSLRDALSNPTIIVRMIMVAFIAGVVALPMEWIHELARDRFARYRTVVAEISSVWGAEQVVTGPILYVPYTITFQTVEEVPLSAAEIAFEQSRGSERVTREITRSHEKTRAALILPNELNIDGHISTETRYRGIYTVRVYTADVNFSGTFTRHNLSGLHQNISDVHWDRAVLVIGITGTRAIRGISELEIAGEKHDFLPGMGGMTVLPSGFSAPGDLSNIAEGDTFAFNFDLSVGGSGGFFMTPLGVSSSFTLTSDWPHPSFTGSGLPVSREIGADGFSAIWSVPNLVRNYPQVDDMQNWGALDINSDFRRLPRNFSGHNIYEYVVGVEFVEPVFHYSLIIRSISHSLLFIVLTFLGIVIFENYYGRRYGVMLSAAQYAVIGAGLALFYLTLLAASEHVGFTTAYKIATAQGVIMTGGYVAAAMRRLRPAVMIAVVQSLLYAMLFMILRMEDYALLAGTALLVAATAALMVVTRDVNASK